VYGQVDGWKGIRQSIHKGGPGLRGPLAEYLRGTSLANPSLAYSHG
jgi:hypothetical protein